MEFSFLLFSDGFRGDVYLTVKLLLPGVIKSVYNLNDKQIVKLFSRIFNCNPDEMARDLEQVRGRCREATPQVGLCRVSFPTASFKNN